MTSSSLKSSFDSIAIGDNGSSPERVLSKFSDSTTITESKQNNTDIKVYVWADNSEKNISLTFEDNHLTAHHQSGLS